jgi:hypothetical protein
MRRSQHYDGDDGDMGQMLLAAGVVLLMSLLSMAVYGVKVAGLGQPYDPASDAVIDMSVELQKAFQPLLENRTNDLITAGMSDEEAIWTAINWTHDDMLHHGEIRGVEVKLLNPVVSQDGDVYTIDADAGIADRHARLSHRLSAIIDLSA